MQFVLKDDGVIERCIQQIRQSQGLQVSIGKPKRSDRQNRLYWNLLNVLAMDTGYTSDELHEKFKVELIGVEYKTISGKELIVPISTTKLTTKQFTEYIDKIYMVGETMGIKLPVPGFWGLE